MNIIPFGEIEKDRFDICKRYGLLECCNGVWRMTAKAKRVYDSYSFINYLKGKVGKPSRLLPKVEKKEEKIVTPQGETHTSEYQQLINEILSM